jgi:tetratricopeptide (TPR) repeat protein
MWCVSSQYEICFCIRTAYASAVKLSYGRGQGRSLDAGVRDDVSGTTSNVSRRSKKRPEVETRPDTRQKSDVETVLQSHRIFDIRVVIVAGLVLVVAAGLWGSTRWRNSANRDRLPPPPQLSAQQKAIEDHLRERYIAAAESPSSIGAVGPMCLAYHADMFFDLAERCYQVAVSLAPEDWRWTYFRAVIQSERGGGEALADSLRRVVQRAPEFGPAWLRLGEAEFKAGRYDEAGRAWEKARDLPAMAEATTSPRHVTEIPLSAYASLGLARNAQVRGDTDTARTILEGVSATLPQFGPAVRLLAESYRHLGRQQEAERLVYRAGRLAPYSPFADPVIDELARESRNSIFLLRLASEANLSINADWSEFLTRRALEFDPKNPEVVLKLARILRTVERNDEALALFEQYQQMVPGDYQVLAHIGSCLSAMGRFGEAESYLRRALQGLDDPITHYNLALLLARTDRLDEAVAEYGKALERDPMHSDARTNLAATLARQGRLDRAAAELKTLLEYDPENAGARTNLGLVLLQQGHATAARGQFEEALRLDPRLAPARDALDALRNQ